jgi:hypothetical protein
MRKALLLAVPAALAAAQLVPVERTNPPAESRLDAPPEIQAILRRACWDCHSNETAWGWHTYVAPISWLAVHDVNEGRHELNFSRWRIARRPERLWRRIVEEVREGEMPPALYVLAHPSARLPGADRVALASWAATLPGGAARDGEDAD